mmetsp:Transcript_5187/g.7208  ORF Transcript_5187/g.7208 Transcript_5187/m.7208 type:complete len:97 (-) Transcript_5187:50-340(-)
MNVTYICCWGLACLVNGAFDVLAIILPLIFDLLTAKLLKITILICIPVSEFFGALFAWHLYHDYAVSGHMNVPDFDPLAKLVNELDPEEIKPLIGK